jgi:hypothetical protein
MKTINLNASRPGKTTALLNDLIENLSKSFPHLHRVPYRNDAKFMVSWLETIRELHPKAVVDLVYIKDKFIGYRYSIVDCLQCKDTGTYEQNITLDQTLKMYCDCQTGRGLLQLDWSNENWHEDTSINSGSWAAGLTGND